MLSCVRLFATPWTIACQSPLSMGLSRQEYFSGLPFPSSGALPDPGIEPMAHATSPALKVDSLLLSHRKSSVCVCVCVCVCLCICVCVCVCIYIYIYMKIVGFEHMQYTHVYIFNIMKFEQIESCKYLCLCLYIYLFNPTTLYFM